MSEPRKFITYPLVIDWLQWSDEFTEDNRPAMALKLIHEFRKHIRDLEAQLAEANAVAEFYGKKSHWFDSCIHPDDVELMHTEMNDPGGKRARQYLEKWKVGK